jgi:hypothetical protein
MSSQSELWDHIFLIYKVADLLASSLEKISQIFKHAVSSPINIDEVQMKFTFMLIT